MKTAVCLVVRNGRQDIVEWIAYHATIGFDTIFVFDNGSSDGTQDIARSTARLHDVRVNPWPEHGSTAKRDCYNNFLLNYGSLYDWVGFIDIDEFIMPLQDASITEFLRKFDGYPAIALNWAIFGSNGFRVPPSGLIIETYTKRSNRHFPSNRHVKSIVRPEFVERAKDRYVFELRSLQAEHHGLKWSYYVDSLGRPIEWSADGNTIASLPELEVCRVNHYYTRSRADFDVKMLHKDWVDAETRDRMFYYNDRNDCTDLSARRFADKVHVFADQIRPKYKFKPAEYGSLPTVPFGNHSPDYKKPDRSEEPFTPWPAL